MTIKELNKLKVPIIRIDPKLDRFEKMNLFQDKVNEANRILERVGLPGEYHKKNPSLANEPPTKYKTKPKLKRKN
jgi:hypothetical protein